MAWPPNWRGWPISGSLDYLRRHAWRPGNLLLRSLADHAPVNYISAVLGLRGS